MPTRVAAPVNRSTNSERLTTAPTREGSVSVYARTEPAGTGIGAVCVERGGQRDRKKVESHTRTEELKTRHATLVRSVMKRFFVLGTPRKKARASRSRASLLHVYSWKYRRDLQKGQGECIRNRSNRHRWSTHETRPLRSLGLGINRRAIIPGISLTVKPSRCGE